MEKEIWKDINGYEGLYQVSNLGRVRRTTYKVLNPTPNDKGYLRVFLSKNNKVKTKYVHILVAEAFIPNPENKPEVNHIKGIKTDNRASKLEWNTKKENMQHAVRIGLIKVGKQSPIYGRKLSNETKNKMKLAKLKNNT